MTAPVPPEAVEAAREAFDEWLHRMHGITSSCDHRAEAEAIAAAVVAALDLPGREREAAAKAWDEGADILPARTEGVDRAGTEAMEETDRDVYSLAIEEAQGVLRARASALRERREA